MIKKITITKLFGRFDYHLEFRSEGIMIITGPNGYGKSTILRMLDSFCNNDIKGLLQYSFKSFVITCTKNQIKIYKYAKTFKINESSFEYPHENWEDEDYSFYMRRLKTRYHDYIHSFLNNIKHSIYDNYGWDKDDIFFVNLLLEYGVDSSAKQSKKILTDLETVYREINEIREEIGKVRFIKEQRLIEIIKPTEERTDKKEEKYINVINSNSDSLKSIIADIMKKHSSLSSELDSTYIKRLFDSKRVNSDTSKVLSELSSLLEKQEKLTKYGLAEIKNVSYIISKLDIDKLNNYSTELSIYLQDANAKYKVFEPLINKLELYEKIVNKKLEFKRMVLSSSNGIEVISEEGNKLSLTDLSSGEQEILVLFYKLIFESDVNLLLIDEPEISLHIAWQKEIMKDMKNVLELNKNFQLIIATHSPQIISHNWDLQVDLGRQYNG